MPSKKLHELSQQIENQNTDSFGKFYLYTMLLHKVTVQDKKTISELLPTHQSTHFFVIKKEKSLHVGPLSYDFSLNIENYSAQYYNKAYSPFDSATNVVNLYFRTGKISDLIEITNRMNGHLAAISSGLNETNQKIYDKLNFKEKQPAIASFLADISKLNAHLLSIADDIGNGIISSLAAVSGLILILATSFSLLTLLLGMGLMVGGATLACNYFESAALQLEQIRTRFESVSKSASKLPQDPSLFSRDKNFINFIVSIIKPIVYLPITTMESVTVNDEIADAISNERNKMDAYFCRNSL